MPVVRRSATVGAMPAPAPRPPHPHKWLVRSMLTAATVLAVLGIFAVWVNRQVLDAGNWADTSSALLENQAIRTQVSDFLVDQVYANTDINGQVAAALPVRLRPLAGPAASGLRDLACALAWSVDERGLDLGHCRYWIGYVFRSRDKMPLRSSRTCF